jgi:hypothetical protein
VYDLNYDEKSLISQTNRKQFPPVPSKYTQNPIAHRFSGDAWVYDALRKTQKSASHSRRFAVGILPFALDWLDKHAYTSRRMPPETLAWRSIHSLELPAGPAGSDNVVGGNKKAKCANT